jgi:hypothetical protein
MVGQMSSPLDLTYLSDTVLLLRFFEAAGEVRRAASVIKKRTGRTRRRFASSQLIKMVYGWVNGWPGFAGC